jgi:hypothetical protein
VIQNELLNPDGKAAWSGYEDCGILEVALAQAVCATYSYTRVEGILDSLVVLLGMEDTVHGCNEPWLVVEFVLDWGDVSRDLGEGLIEWFEGVTA